MLAVFFQTLRESFHRWMGLILMGFCLMLATFYLWYVHFELGPNGILTAYTRTQGRLGPAAQYTQRAFGDLLMFCGGPFLLLGIFAVAPLLTSYLEKGWVDLVLSKGVARWQVLLARLAGAFGLVFSCYAILCGVPALYFWAGAGVFSGRFFAAVGVVMLSFATLAALMALAAIAMPNPAIPIIVAFLQTLFSTFLFQREQLLYEVITAKWARWLIDWLYRILPKTTELNFAATKYLRTGTLDWWPVWSSALFLAGTLALAWYTFHRKSY